jgi:hypothetical protein
MRESALLRDKDIDQVALYTEAASHYKQQRA